MIPAGYVNALLGWADDSDAVVRAARIVLIKEERDALVQGFLSGGKPSRTLIAGGVGAKTFTWSANLTREEKLTICDDLLRALGALSESSEPVKFTYGAFSNLTR